MDTCLLSLLHSGKKDFQHSFQWLCGVDINVCDQIHHFAQVAQCVPIQPHIISCPLCSAKSHSSDIPASKTHEEMSLSCIAPWPHSFLIRNNCPSKPLWNPWQSWSIVSVGPLGGGMYHLVDLASSSLPVSSFPPVCIKIKEVNSTNQEHTINIRNRVVVIWSKRLPPPLPDSNEFCLTVYSINDHYKNNLILLNVKADHAVIICTEINCTCNVNDSQCVHSTTYFISVLFDALDNLFQLLEELLLGNWRGHSPVYRYQHTCNESLMKSMWSSQLNSFYTFNQCNFCHFMG